MKTYKDLIVWQKSFQLCILIYKNSKQFPKEELYVLVSQMRRCGLSIPSNIAEGYSRKGRKEYSRFIRIAFGSARELETQLLLAKELGYLKEKEFAQINNLLEEVLKMLNALLSKLEE